jgi:alanyl-tRNA synthetase
MKAREARKAFLDYFQERGHVLVPSSPVIPHGDKTLLFTNAGMNQFKDIFTGKQKASFPRATTAQKCLRAGGKHNDLDNVGYTTRHLTFFEMLGNFSFGDYFKKDAILFAWELVTRRFGISPGRLWITVFREDDEARDLWRKIAGVADDRIVGLGEKDNYWSMGDVGPCGPCSEILVDRGDEHGPPDLENGERFFEIWNLVFMQFDQRPNGAKAPLPRPSIDTGMGLERMAMVLQGVNSVFETDVFVPLIRRVEEITGTRCDPGAAGVPHRVIADHIRSLVFAFADGAEPSNEGRGYVLRRILRRAARYARKISKGEPILHQLVEDVVEQMGESYPEIREHKNYITQLIRSEEERFGETLDKGLELFEDVTARLKRASSKTIPGSEVFKLYDTFGFPADLVQQMAAEIGFEVDSVGFEKLMGEQKERSRGASQFYVRSTDGFEVEKLPPTQFVGYGQRQARAELQAASEQGETWRLVLSATPFYGESGGQVGDTGILSGDGFLLAVEDTKKEKGRFIHYCRLRSGDPAKIRSGEIIEAAVDEARREAIERNHTATHLLHAGLRKAVGAHVHQKGSLVEPARLRFDVTHFAPLKREELEEVERLVQEQILQNSAVETFETDFEDAVKQGAMALFGEKYGDRVRVVKIGGFSLELCGGTHVTRTGEIGPFLVAGEGSVSAGVRRLEALTAGGAESLHRKNREIIEGLSRALKVSPEGLSERIEKLLEENRDLKARRKAEGAAFPASGLESSPSGNLPSGNVPSGIPVRREKLGNVHFLTATFAGLDGKGLREAHDRFKQEAPELVTVLFAPRDGKVQILVAVSSPLVQKGWDAREIFQAGAPRLAARGGGRPEMVQAGGTEAPGSLEGAVTDMLAAVKKRAGEGAK